MVLAVHITILHSNAHVGDLIDTLDVATRDDQPAVEGTFGLLLGQEDDTWRWVCHETVLVEGSTLNARYVHHPTAGSLAWILPSDARDGHPVWGSPDLCSWEAATGLEDRLIAAVSFAPDGTAYAATADPALGNGVFRSGDARAFSPTEASSSDRFLSVEASGGTVWATSSDDLALTVWRSLDGVAFTSVSVPPIDGVSPPIRGRIAAVNPLNQDEVWLVVDPIGVDFLLHSIDGGQTFDRLWDAPDRITDFDHAEDGSLYAILNDRRPYRAIAGEEFVEMTALPDASGLDVVPGGLQFSNRAFVNGLLFTRSERDGSNAQSLPPEVITGPLVCAPSTDGAMFCDPLWEQLEARLQPPTDSADTGDDTDDPPLLTPPLDSGDPPVVEPGCGCTTPPTGAGAWLPVLALLFGIRRPRLPPQGAR